MTYFLGSLFLMELVGVLHTEAVGNHVEKDLTFHTQQGDGTELHDVLRMSLLWNPNSFCMVPLFSCLHPLLHYPSDSPQPLQESRAMFVDFVWHSTLPWSSAAPSHSNYFPAFCQSGYIDIKLSGRFQ